MEAGLYSPTKVICSAHFWPGSLWTLVEKNAAFQWADSEVWTPRYGIHGKVVVGADLYLSRSQVADASPIFYQWWRDSFACPGTIPLNIGTHFGSSNPNLQYGHILGTNSVGCPMGSGFRHDESVCNATNFENCYGSDHNLLYWFHN